MCIIIKFSLAAPVEKIARRISEALPRSPESSGRRPEARGDLGSASHMRSVGANAGEECRCQRRKLKLRTRGNAEA